MNQEAAGRRPLGEPHSGDSPTTDAKREVQTASPQTGDSLLNPDTEPPGSLNPELPPLRLSLPLGSHGD